MASELQGISKIGDVGYLLTQLRVARRKKESEIREAIVSRLKEIDVLREAEDNEDFRFKKVRAEVGKILGT